MKSFARLFAELDRSTATRAKHAALVRYFEAIGRGDDERSIERQRDAAWAVYFLAGGKPRQTVPTRILRDTARDVAALPDWLFEESYQAVGDLAETIAHVLPPPSRSSDLGLATWIEHRLLGLKREPPDVIAARLAAWWDELDTGERFLLIKLIGGSFRVGVSKLSVTRALATVSGVDAKIIAHRLMGYTDGRTRPSADGVPRADRAGVRRRRGRCGDATRRTARTAVSVLPRARAQRAGRALRRAARAAVRLARRMEVRRHPRPARRPRRRGCSSGRAARTS